MSELQIHTGLNNGSGFGTLVEQADVLARSNLVPKAFRGKPADVLVAMMLGNELGLGPMATMSMVDVIEGNATLNAEGKVSLVRKAGHSINGEALATKAVAQGRRKDTGDEMTVEWTIEMASRAGLANKQVWKQYPEAMLWSRAVSQLCRMLFPDVLVGLSYTPEEVEAFTGDGTVSPPANVHVTTGEIAPKPSTRRGPPQIAGGLIPPVEAASARERGAPAPPVPAAELQRERMRIVERLELLGDEAKARARAEWMGSLLPPPSKLADETEVATADAIVAEAERMQLNADDESSAEHG